MISHIKFQMAVAEAPQKELFLMTRSIILTFIEYAEHFRSAQNVHNLQFNILILDLAPFIKFSLRS